MDAAGHDFPPDQRLALAYASKALRRKFEALLRFDAELAAAVSAASEPLLAQVRLAWWRDALASSITETARVPLLGDLSPLGHSDLIFPHLTAMVNGWETLLSPFPIAAETLLDYAKGRGGGLFLAAEAVAGCGANGSRDLGIGWALGDFAFRCSDAETASRAHGLARESLSSLPRMSKAMRPFALLARFARTDSHRELRRGSAAGSPSRLLDAAKVVLTGK